MGKKIEISVSTNDLANKTKQMVKNYSANYVKANHDYKYQYLKKDIESAIYTEYYTMIKTFFDQRYVKDFYKFLKQVDAIEAKYLFNATEELTSNFYNDLLQPLEYGFYGKSIGNKYKKLFIEEYNKKPITDYNNLVLEKRSNVSHKKIEYECEEYEEIYSQINKSIQLAEKIYPSASEKQMAINKLKKDITNYTVKYYGNVRGFGEFIGLVYRNFYGKNFTEIKDYLNKDGNRVVKGSLDSIMNKEHLNCKLSILMIIYNKLQSLEYTEIDECDMKLFAASTGQISKEIFMQNKSITPLKDLEITTKKEISNEKQLSIMDIIEPRQRNKK